MKEITIQRIYEGLSKKRKVDLSPLLKEEMKTYKDSPKKGEPDQMVTKVTLEYVGGRDPQLIANLYEDQELVENHYYYLDQKDKLRKLLSTWLKLK